MAGPLDPTRMPNATDIALGPGTDTAGFAVRTNGYRASSYPDRWQSAVARLDEHREAEWTFSARTRRARTGPPQPE
jgi:hypothetical protein